MHEAVVEATWDIECSDRHDNRYRSGSRHSACMLRSARRGTRPNRGTPTLIGTAEELGHPIARSPTWWSDVRFGLDVDRSVPFDAARTKDPCEASDGGANVGDHVLGDPITATDEATLIPPVPSRVRVFRR